MNLSKLLLCFFLCLVIIVTLLPLASSDNVGAQTPIVVEPPFDQKAEVVIRDGDCIENFCTVDKDSGTIHVGTQACAALWQQAATVARGLLYKQVYIPSDGTYTVHIR